MKSLLFIFAFAAILVQSVVSQNSMYIHKTDGTVLQVQLKEIDSIIFYDSEISDGSVVTDVEGNVYNTLTFGSQKWMAENLKTTKYNTGVTIPLIDDDEIWAHNFGPAYCWFDDNEASYKDMYGALYNWYVVSTEILCPSGWHVPTQEDWDTFEEFLIAGGYNFDGTKTGDKVGKALASKTEWASSAAEGTVGNTDYPEKRNATGFTGRPGGLRESITFDGHFSGWSVYAIWWTATEYSATSAHSRELYNKDVGLITAVSSKNKGHYVRCVQD